MKKVDTGRFIAFLSAFLTCGIITSCTGSIAVGFIIGIVFGNVIPLGYYYCSQNPTHNLSIYNLDNWRRFVQRCSTYLLMFVLNLMYLSDYFEFSSLSEDSSKFHLFVVFIVFSVAAVCVLLTTVFLQRFIVMYFLVESGKSVSSIVVMVANWLVVVFLKLFRLRNFELGSDVFAFYQIGITVLLIVSIVSFFNSRVLFIEGVECTKYSTKSLPSFLLQSDDSLFYRSKGSWERVFFEGTGSLFVSLYGGRCVQYHCELVDGSLSWSVSS